MKSKNNLIEALLGTSIACVAGFAAAPVMAQDSTTQQADEQDGDETETSFDAAASGTPQVEEVVVTGIRQSLERGIDIKRESMQIVDAIVAEDIGKFPDNNVVEALQRVTGVQVTDRGAGEVTTVSIRGLNDVTTLVNGRNIFTTSGRSVALADIPANLLARTDVYKSRSADLIESGIAGVLDIHTQRPFNFDGRKISVAARGIYQEQSDEYDPNISALFSNIWDTEAGSFGALLNVSYAETNYRDQSVTAGAMVPFWTDEPPPGYVPFQRAPATYDRVGPDGQIETVQIWQPGLPSGLPFAPGSTLPYEGQEYEYLLSRDAVFSSDLTGKRERPAANISLQWAPNDRSEYLFEAFYNGYRNESFNSLLFSFVDWWGNLGPNPGSTIELYDGTNIIKERTVGAPYTFTSGDLTTGKTDSYVYALGGSWDLTDKLSLESEIVYQDSEFESDFFAMRAEKVTNAVWVDFNSGDGLPAYGFIDNPDTDIDESDPSDVSQWNMAQLYDNANYSKGDALSFTTDGNYYADWGVFREVDFGLRYDDRSASEGLRTQNSNICDVNDTDPDPSACLFSSYPGLVSINEGFFDGNSDVPTSWFVPNGYYIRDNAAMFREIYNENSTGTNLATGSDLSVPENFSVDEATAALYAQADFETTVAGRILDGQIGVRYVDIQTDMSFVNQVTGEQETASKSTTKLLPSLMVRYQLTPDVMARFSYGETIRRPNFAQLNPVIIYTPDVTDIGYGTAAGGNPDLDPVESQNFDVSLEWYFAPASSLYGALFRRDIEGLIVDYRQRVIANDYPYILSSPQNASDGVLEGLELGLIYFPDYLPQVLDGLGVQASFTSLDSEQTTPITNTEGEVVGEETTPMFGVSDTSYSVVLAYEKSLFDARLSYVWRDDFLNNYEAAQFANPLGVYRAPEKSLDFQFSYYATEDLTLTFDATNITEEIYQSYYEYPATHNFGSALYSRTFALGVRYDF